MNNERRSCRGKKKGKQDPPPSTRIPQKPFWGRRERTTWILETNLTVAKNYMNVFLRIISSYPLYLLTPEFPLKKSNFKAEEIKELIFNYDLTF